MKTTGTTITELKAAFLLAVKMTRSNASYEEVINAFMSRFELTEKGAELYLNAITRMVVSK
jgi:hypothetical protein